MIMEKSKYKEAESYSRILNNSSERTDFGEALKTELRKLSRYDLNENPNTFINVRCINNKNIPEQMSIGQEFSFQYHHVYFGNKTIGGISFDRLELIDVKVQ